MKPKTPSSLRRVLNAVKKYRLLIFLSCALAVGSVVLTLYVPILIGDAIDLIAGENNVKFEAILRILVQIAIIVAASALMQWLMNIINNRITYQVVRDIRSQAFNKLNILPLKYLDSHSTGDIVSRIIADVDQFAEGLLLGFTQFFTGIITILGTLVFMLSVHWGIALLVVLLTPISLLTARFISKHTYSMFLLQSTTRGEQTTFINEMITGQKVVKAFSHEKKATEQFSDINERLEKASLRATFFSSLTNPTTRFVNSIVYALVGLTGALAAVKGTLTVGGLSIFLSYANQYTKPFNEISGVITELQNALVCAGRVFELIDQTSQIPENPNAVILDNPEGHITLTDVAFSYVPEKPLIRNLNLEVKPGRRVAIVGPTGCGKTTVINLLMRFYDVNAGSISVDGTDIRDITRASLRKSYGMVLQDTWLKDGSIRENLKLGNPSASDEEMIQAAKDAHTHSFIKHLPQGYDTVIGEGIGSLSHGQMQLLCIARVMLCDPDMLILDEATSSIDTRTELKIQDAFARLMKGRTTFIVAHRLSTIRDAEIILVMRDGQVVEQGKHEELLSSNGFYANLYNSQFAI